MIDCLNFTSSSYEKMKKEKRKKWLREHFKLYKKFDDWFQNCNYTKRKMEKLKQKDEELTKRIYELLEEMKEVDKEWQAKK